MVLMAIPNFSRWFISRHLELSEMPFDPIGSRKDVERFVAGYLKTDGVFVLRMIAMHAGVIFGTDLVLNLWRAFYGIEEEYRKNTPSTGGVDESKENKFNFIKLRRRRRSEEGAPRKPSDKELMQVLLPDGKGTKAVIANQDSQGEDENDEQSENDEKRDVVQQYQHDLRQESKSERDPKRHKNYPGMQKRSSEPTIKTAGAKYYSESETLPKKENV